MIQMVQNSTVANNSQESYIKAYQLFDLRMKSLRDYDFTALEAYYRYLCTQQQLDPHSFAFETCHGIRMDDVLNCVSYHYWN